MVTWDFYGLGPILLIYYNNYSKFLLSNTIKFQLKQLAKIVPFRQIYIYPFYICSRCFPIIPVNISNFRGKFPGPCNSKLLLLLFRVFLLLQLTTSYHYHHSCFYKNPHHHHHDHIHQYPTKSIRSSESLGAAEPWEQAGWCGLRAWGDWVCGVAAGCGVEEVVAGGETEGVAAVMAGRQRRHYQLVGRWPWAVQCRAPASRYTALPTPPPSSLPPPPAEYRVPLTYPSSWSPASKLINMILRPPSCTHHTIQPLPALPCLVFHSHPYSSLFSFCMCCFSHRLRHYLHRFNFSSSSSCSSLSSFIQQQKINVGILMKTPAWDWLIYVLVTASSWASAFPLPRCYLLGWLRQSGGGGGVSGGWGGKDHESACFPCWQCVGPRDKRNDASSPPRCLKWTW